MFGGVEEILEV